MPTSAERVLLRRQGRAQRETRHNNDQLLTQRRDDLAGIRMSDSDYNSMLEAKGSADKNYSDGMEAVAKSKQLIAKEAASLDNKWNKVESKFVPIKVYTGDRFEGEYRVPRAVVDKLNSDVFNKGDGTYTGNWKSSSSGGEAVNSSEGEFYNVDTELRGGGGYGKELHEMLGGVVTQVHDEFYQVNGELLKKTIAGLNSQVADAEGALSMQKQATEQEIQGIKSDQDAANGRMGNTMSSLNVQDKQTVLGV